MHCFGERGRFVSAFPLSIPALPYLSFSKRHDLSACLHTALPNVLVVIWPQVLELLLFLPSLVLLLVAVAVVVAAAVAAAAHFHAYSCRLLKATGKRVVFTCNPYPTVRCCLLSPGTSLS